MRKNTVTIVMLLVVVFALGSMLYHTDTAMAQKSLSPELKKELSQVIKNQEEIISRLDDVMKELKIVKVRATK